MRIWPFVSRERFEEAKDFRDKRIASLEQEVRELREDHKLLVDVFGVRALGVSVYGKVQMPKDEEPELPDDGEPKPGEQLSPPVGRARAVKQFAEARNLKQYTDEMDEMHRLVEAAKEEGRLAALANATNGNGNHT